MGETAKHYDSLVFSEYKMEVNKGLLTNISGAQIIDIRLVESTEHNDISEDSMLIEVVYLVPPSNNATRTQFNLVSPLSLTEETVL
jgi:hypothetical protein